MIGNTSQHDPRRIDYWLLLAVVLMVAIGLIMVWSASGIMAERQMGSRYHFAARQMLFAIAGMGIMTACMWVPLERVFKSVYVLLGGTLVCLLLTLGGPLALRAGGAARWLRLGPVSLQPLEMCKVVLVIYLAYFFSTKQHNVKSILRGVLPPGVVTGIFAALLLLQPDFGGAIFMFLLFALMWLAGGGAVWQFVLAASMGAFGGILVLKLAAYRIRRLTAFLDPFADPLGAGYQLVQSLYAFGSGGLWGKGLGESQQKLLFLPEAHNDFIMAVVGEELGFVGIVLLFAFIGVILWRGFSIALAAEELRDRLLAFGLTAILGLGFLLNLAVVLAAAPPKGVPMPFMSYGGSHLVIALICVGLLLNISRRSA